MIPMWNWPPSWRTKAIRSPLGLHTGAVYRPWPKLMRCWCEPSVSMT